MPPEESRLKPPLGPVAVSKHSAHTEVPVLGEHQRTTRADCDESYREVKAVQVEDIQLMEKSCTSTNTVGAQISTICEREIGYPHPDVCHLRNERPTCLSERDAHVQPDANLLCGQIAYKSLDATDPPGPDNMTQ